MYSIRSWMSIISDSWMFKKTELSYNKNGYETYLIRSCMSVLVIVWCFIIKDDFSLNQNSFETYSIRTRHH
jgi:hypothetical protein